MLGIADKEITIEEEKTAVRRQNGSLRGIRNMGNRTDITNNSQNGILNQITPRCDFNVCRFYLPSGECSSLDQRRHCLEILLTTLPDPQDARAVLEHLEEMREELGL